MENDLALGFNENFGHIMSLNNDTPKIAETIWIQSALS